ncbi:MAG: NYN domain-containing protein [Candidatus Lokiarchaeota archaeon]|nr:NYN domain-containing protein [Candidatus Lokiarchaeota archaeon]
MTAEEQVTKISIFWDLENVHDIYSTHEAMTKAIHESGKVVKSYAFADWDTRRRMAEELYDLGYDLIHVPDSKDNAADYKMAAYILEHLSRFPEVNCYVMVTGDGDFKLLAGALRQQGNRLWIISNPIITSSEMSDLANRYSDIHAFRPTDLDCSDPADCERLFTSSDDSRRIAAVRLREAVQAIKDAGNKPGIGHVKHVMRSLNPNFNEHQLGFSNWSSFLEWAESKGYIKQEGELPSTIITVPEEVPEDTTKLSEDVRDAFSLLVSVVEDKIQQNEPTTVAVINSELKEQGVDVETIGYPKIADFLLSADKRGFIRVIPSEENQSPTILPYCSLDKVRAWFKDNVTELFGSSVKVPRDAFLEKIMNMLLENKTTLHQMETFLKSSEIRSTYNEILKASSVPFLPPFQMSLAHILLGQGKSCEETVALVNEELRHVSITLECP